MKVGIFLTNQNPVGRDMVSAREDQYVMTRLARDRGWDAVATGQQYLSEGMSQLTSYCRRCVGSKLQADVDARVHVPQHHFRVWRPRDSWG